jgi:hypothetical protein
MRGERLLFPTFRVPPSWQKALRRRSSRRVTLLGCLACIAVYIGTGCWAGTHWTVTFLASAGWYLGLFWLASATTFRIVIFRRQPEHDERERELSDRAIHISYEILGAIAFLILVAYSGSSPESVYWWSQHLSLNPEPDVARALAFQIGLSIPLLPSAVLAWIEPDPPEDP